MNKKEIENIKNAIVMCQIRLKNIAPYIKKSENLSTTYNRILIEKAVLKEKLQHKKNNLFQRTLKKLNPKKIAICDYFN